MVLQDLESLPFRWTALVFGLEYPRRPVRRAVLELAGSSSRLAGLELARGSDCGRALEDDRRFSMNQERRQRAAEKGHARHEGAQERLAPARHERREGRA